MRALYTITTETAQVRYAGNGVTTAFPVSFQFFEASTLRVRTAVSATVSISTLGVDYLVSGGDGGTGVVTFVTAPPSGTNVIIDLNIPMLQETVDLSPNGPLPAEDVEQGFDRIVTMVKQLRQQLLAVPELDATFNPDTDQPPILPPPAAGQVLAGRDDGLGWENRADVITQEALDAALAQFAAQYPPGSDTTGMAILETPLRRLAATVVDPKLVQVKSVYQTPAGTTWTVEFKQPHGFTGTPSATFNLRIDGWHGKTKRAHPANGNWSFSVVDTKTIILTGSVFVANCKYLSGWGWSGTLDFDARPVLTLLALAARDDGGGTITLPAGGIPILSTVAPLTPRCIELYDDTTFVGSGREQTFLCAKDNVDGFMIAVSGYSRVNIEKMTLYCNRQNMASGGLHGIRTGASGKETDRLNIRECNIFATGGYGLAYQNGSYKNCDIEDVLVSGCDSDGFDIKDPDLLNVGNTVTNLRVFEFGMNTVGVDLPGVALAANPFTTTNGSSVVTIADTAHGFAVGQIVSFAPFTPFNGLALDADGYLVGLTTSVAADSYTIDFGQIASASGTGGGASVLRYAPQISAGDAGIDLRGKSWAISDCHVVGNLEGKGGIRLREIGDSMTVTNCTVENTGTKAGSGGFGLAASNSTIVGGTVINCATGLSTALSDGSSATGVTFVNCGTAVYGFGTASVISNCVAEGSVVVSFRALGTDQTFNHCLSKGSTLGFWSGPGTTGGAFNNCYSLGDTTTHLDQAAGNTIWNSPQFSVKPRTRALPTAGTTNPTLLVEKDMGSTFYVVNGSTEKALVTLPAAVARLAGSRVRFRVLDTDGIDLFADVPIRMIGSTTTPGSTVLRSTTVGSAVTLELSSVNTSWVVVEMLGTWAVA